MAFKMTTRVIITTIAGAVGLVSLLTLLWAITAFQETQLFDDDNKTKARSLYPINQAGDRIQSQILLTMSNNTSISNNDNMNNDNHNSNIYNKRNEINDIPNSNNKNNNNNNIRRVPSNIELSYFMSELNLLEPNKEIITQLDRSRMHMNNLLLNLPIMDINKLPKNNKCKHNGKVFAIGLMKTGTTSIVKALNKLGYQCYSDSCLHVGNWKYPGLADAVLLWQPQEIIVNAIFNVTEARKKYIEVSSKAMAFGDSPWCFLWPVWDVLYPNSKFILMERDSIQTYVRSYINYLQSFGKSYVTQGLKSSEFAMLAARRYELHNQRVIEYFRDRPDDLLVWNINSPQAQANPWKQITDFLGCPEPTYAFPHLNSGGSSKKKKPASYLQEYPDMNWKKFFGENNIPYVHRDNGKDSLHLHVVKQDEFVSEFCC